MPKNVSAGIHAILAGGVAVRGVSPQAFKKTL